MCASLSFGFGFGLKKLKAILNKYPNILEHSVVSYEMIECVDGFSTKTSKKFVDNLQNFKHFLQDLNFLTVKPYKKIIESNGDLFQNHKIVMTGFRCPEIIQFIEKNKGTLSNSAAKTTKLLIVKDKEYHNNKVDAANILGLFLF